jgi:hypothetical protein
VPPARSRSDVGAVVLSLGEPTTGRALASLREQTLPVEDVVIVEGVSPFHRALNAGVARSTKPFVVQVDADMVLDPHCTEVLRHAMAPNVGIAVGALRDPLVGTIAGVKMFRRECFRDLQLRDTIAPEVDFYVELGELGWRTMYLTGHGPRRPPAPTIGDHRPAYTADYVFGTYHPLGTRYVHRADLRGLIWRLRQLRSSSHAMAPVARVAMGHGVFAGETRDVAKPSPSAADSRFLRELAATPEAHVSPRRVRRLLALAPQPLVDGFRELGASLRKSSHARFRGCLRLLAEADHRGSLLAEVALCDGALAASPASAPEAILATAHPG